MPCFKIISTWRLRSVALASIGLQALHPPVLGFQVAPPVEREGLMCTQGIDLILKYNALANAG